MLFMLHEKEKRVTLYFKYQFVNMNNEKYF